MFVTREPCADCGPVIADKGIPIEWVRDPHPPPRNPSPTPAPGAKTGGVPPPPDAPPPGAKPQTQSQGGKTTTAVVGNPIAPVAEHGPSARGAAKMEGGVMALQLLGTLFNHFGAVKILRSTVLVSEQGEALYGNSILPGRTFNLKPEQ